MKTIEEFIKEIDGSEALQNQLEEIRDKDALEAFLKKNDVSGTGEEFADAVKAKVEGEIPDNDTEAVAGGLDIQRMIESEHARVYKIWFDSWYKK